MLSHRAPAGRTAHALTLLLCSVLTLAACASKPLPIGNLYQRLGGEDAVAKIMDDFVVNVQQDPRINEQFSPADLSNFKSQLAVQICDIGGGACNGTEASMRTVYQGMQFASPAFDAFVGDLVKALDQHDVAPADQRELLFKLESMRADVMAQDADK